MRALDDQLGGDGHGAEPIRTFSDACRRYDSIGPGTALSYARERFEELTNRDLSARATATLKARGEYNPARHRDPAMHPPLTADERLEVLALGELLARHYRHPAYVHDVVISGASWAQVAEAVGRTEKQVRGDYVQWANSQHDLWQHYEGRFGMSDADHAAAIRRASCDRAEPQMEAGR